MKAEQLSRLEQRKRASGLRIGCRSGEEAPTKKLLDTGSVFPSLITPTEREVYKMNPVSMDNGEGSGAPLGVRAPIGRVVAKL